MQEDPPVSNRTRILFAVVGICACLIGALCAELTFGRMRAAARLQRYHAASLLYITDPQTTRETVQVPAAAPPDDSELQRRLDGQGALSGDVQVSLTWNNNNDLDLSCMDPYGEMIDGYNQSSRSGGVLDVDMNPTDDRLMTPEAIVKLRGREINSRAHRTSYANEQQPAPVENLVWAHDAPVGHYKVFVHQFCNKERVEQTPFWVIVRVHGQVHRIAGVMGREDFAENLVDPRLVYEFDVGPKSAAATPPKQVVAAPVAPPPPRIVTHVGYSLNHIDYAVLIASLWGALAGLLPIALLYAQRAYLRYPIWSGEQDLIVALGGPVTGFTAALIGQLLFSLLGSAFAPNAFNVLFVLGWTLLGGLFGVGLSLYTPNVPRIAAPITGALSALVGSLIFLLLGRHGADLAGHLLSASLIGGSIGALVALPEREREPEPEPAPPLAPRATYEVQPPFIVRGTSTRKVGGLRQTDRRSGL
jgi:hypothetical protein